MDLGRTFQQLLLRDILSHLVPGFLLLLTVALAFLNIDDLARRHQNLEQEFGSFWETTAVLSVSYIAGYLLHSCFRAGFDYVRKRRRAKSSGVTSGDLASLRDSARKLLGAPFNKLPDTFLVDACGQILRYQDPEYYLERVDRRNNLRNLSISLVGLFTVMAVLLGLQQAAWWWATASFALATAIGLTWGIRTLEIALDEIQLVGILALNSKAVRTA